MNREQAMEKLHPYMDGELGPEELEAVRAALAEHPDVAGELKEMEAVRAFAREAFEAPAAEADFSNLFGNVMARLESEGVLRTSATPAQAAAPGFFERASSWLADFFTLKHPVAAMAVAAAVVAGVWLGTRDDGGAPGGAAPEIAKGERETAPGGTAAPEISRPRRGMETEVAVAPSFEGRLESWEADRGEVFAENQGNPDAPMVVWHIVDESGGATAEEGL